MDLPAENQYLWSVKRLRWLHWRSLKAARALLAKEVGASKGALTMEILEQFAGQAVSNVLYSGGFHFHGHHLAVWAATEKLVAVEAPWRAVDGVNRNLELPADLVNSCTYTWACLERSAAPQIR
jgi:hypothetical protein